MFATIAIVAAITANTINDKPQTPGGIDATNLHREPRKVDTSLVWVIPKTQNTSINIASMIRNNKQLPYPSL